MSSRTLATSHQSLSTKLDFLCASAVYPWTEQRGDFSYDVIRFRILDNIATRNASIEKYQDALDIINTPLDYLNKPIKENL
jgi:hypothetical protein